MVIMTGRSDKRPAAATGVWLFVWVLALVLATLAASGAAAQPANDPLPFLPDSGESPGRGSPSMGGDGPGLALLKMLGALCLVLGLILFVAWLAKRYLPAAAGATGARGDAIRVLSTRMLGGRRSLTLVRVRGQTLLLGVTPQSINTLTEVHEIDGEWAQPADAAGKSASSSAFDRRLGHLIDQSVTDEDPS